jgi:hypothetical protein
MKPMTLRKLADRLNAVLRDNPKLADLPFCVKVTRSRRRTEYIPLSWVSSSRLGLGPGGGHTLEVVEAHAAPEDIVMWDSSNGCPKPNWMEDAQTNSTTGN